MINSKYNIKYALEGILVFHSSFFTAAAMEMDSKIDTCILKTPDRKLILNGSTIAGKLRSTLENIFGEQDDRIKKIFGYQDCSSRIIFNDSIAENSLYEERQCVAIDRNTGTAAEGLLYDKEIAPPYIQFKIKIELDSSDETGAGDLEILRLIEKLLSGGFVNFGGNSSRGSGFCFLKNNVVKKAVLSEEKGFISYLLDNMEKESEASGAAEVQLKTAGKYSSVLLEYELEFNQGVLPGDKNKKPEFNDEKTDSDIMPYFMRTPDGEYFIIPGSSIKGVLRTKAESIFLKRNVGYICDPTSPRLKGYCNKSYKADKKPEALCEACKIFGAVNYASKVLFSDLIMEDKISASQMKKVEHVAIDRFTGGGIESCKFNETVVEKPVYKGYIALRNPSLNDMNILTHLALEMNDGKIRTGHSTRKGFGRLAPKLLSVKVFACSPENEVMSALTGGASFKTYKGAEFIETFKKHLSTIENGRNKANE